MSEIAGSRIGRPPRPLSERFWEKVGKQPGCWIWTGKRNRQGYGRAYSGGEFGYEIAAHRLAWELTNGPIPPGLCVLHRCDNPSCVNPDHLWLGSQADNVRDMIDKGRRGDSSLIGVRNGRAKLTPEAAGQIRSLHARGLATYTDLARVYGVGKSTICRVVLERAWMDGGARGPVCR
jgi:HNH endonuclease